MPTLQEVTDLKNACLELLSSFDQVHILNQINELEAQLALPDIWDQHQKAGKLNQSLAAKQEFIKELQQFNDAIDNLTAAVDLDDSLEVKNLFSKLTDLQQQLQNQKYLNGRFDNNGTILTVHAGAGGIDAQDWASMLLSMYQAFIKNMNWEVNLISLSNGEEGGVKSATIEVRGLQSYGYLKEEAGVHRLVRISPFNSGGTRETSFALVEVIPDNVIDEVEAFEIKEEDLKWDTFMAGGKGGQSVNTTYSAVRVTHLPTKIVVVCQNERNQIQNRQIALKHLKNKLAVLEVQKHQELKKELRGEFHSPEWGSQIRNYVLHPYKLVKDTRSGFETTNVDKILEQGELLEIIWSVKKAKGST